MTVDGVLCPYKEVGGHKNPKFFSFKHKRAGLLYEIAMAIFEDRCVWISGPLPGGETNDKGHFNRGLRQRIPQGKKFVGDSAYGSREDAHIGTWRRDEDPEHLRLFKRRALARHEAFNGRMKRFKTLSTVFRSSVDGHKSAFYAIAVLCQYEMELGSPLFKVGV